jgi:hypothetical protein
MGTAVMGNSPDVRSSRRFLFLLLMAGAFATLGCSSTPVDLSQVPAALRFRLPKGDELSCRYEDDVTAGQLFTIYCSYCHNARPLAERPFSNYQNVLTHMRVRANLTGEEAAKIEAWMRRWHDVPSPSEPVEPSPSRLTFPQPIAELRPQPPAQARPPQPPVPADRGAAPDLPPAIP